MILLEMKYIICIHMVIFEKQAKTCQILKQKKEKFYIFCPCFSQLQITVWYKINTSINKNIYIIQIYWIGILKLKLPNNILYIKHVSMEKLAVIYQHWIWYIS